MPPNATLEDLLENLRPYQLHDLWKSIHRDGRFGLFYEMRCGKTVTAIATFRFFLCRSILVSGPEVCSGVWEDEIAKWWPGALFYSYRGKPKERDAIWQQYNEDRSTGLPQVMFCGFSMAHELVERQTFWEGMAVDECHRVSNHQTRVFKALDKVKNYRCQLLSGSPAKRQAVGFYAYFKLLRPKDPRYSSYWRWVHSTLSTLQGKFGLEILGPKNLEAFRKEVGGIAVRRKANDPEVRGSMPDNKIPRQRILVEMDSRVRKIYDDLLGEMLATMDGHFITAANAAVRTMRLRQLLVSPKLLGFDWISSAAIDAAVDKVLECLDNDESFVIFTPFRDAVHIICEEIEAAIPQALKGTVPLFKVLGQQGTGVNDAAIRQFQDIKCPAGLVATVRTGISWSAWKATTFIGIGCEWSPDNQEQAEARLEMPPPMAHLHPDRRPVARYYTCHRNSIEEEVLSAINQKLHAINLIVDGNRHLRATGKDQPEL